MKTLKQILREIQNSHKMKLIDVYDGFVPSEEDESAIHEYVRPNEWNLFYPIKILSVDELKELTAYYSGKDILSDFEKNKNKSVIKKINDIRHLIKTNQDI